MLKPLVRSTIRKTPAWEKRTLEAARQFGISEAKLTRQVKKELIRLAAEQIARDEHQRAQAEKYARPHTIAGLSGASKAQVHHSDAMGESLGVEGVKDKEG